MKKNKIIRIFKILLEGLFYVFIGLSVFCIFVVITSKKDSDGTATVFNYQLRIVQSDSMEKCSLTDVSKYDIKSIPIKSVVFVETIPENDISKQSWYDSLEIGDVLTFKYVYAKQETITHRIVDIEKKDNSSYVITLEGDNKTEEGSTMKQVIDTSIIDSPNYIIGKVTGQSYLLGLIIYGLKNPIGLVLIIIIPCIIIIILEIIKIISLLLNDKKKKLIELDKVKNNEIESLKEELRLLKEKGGVSE